MRTALVVVALVFAAGCDFEEGSDNNEVGGDEATLEPGDGITFALRNLYADSIFTLAIELTDANGAQVKRTITTDNRIESGDVKSFETGHVVPEGGSASFLLSVMSLGEVHDFGVTDMGPQDGDNFCIFYDYDLATANFTAYHGWTVGCPE